MKSKQINFFLTANDQAALVNSFREEGQFVVVHPRVHDGKIHALDDAEIKEMGKKSLKVFLVQPKNVNLIQFNELKNQTHKVVDIVRSPVIEFMRCFHAANILRRGRLYFIAGYYVDNTLKKKPNDFLIWAEKIVSISRRKLKKDSGSFYFGGNALALRATGTHFEGLPFTRVPPPSLGGDDTGT